jgi:hypothetical protein
MHDHQQNQRIAAARAFMESLSQLQNIWEAEHQSAESGCQSECEFSEQNQTDSNIWEEAVADLDAFLGDQELPQAEMLDEENE